MNGAQAVNGFHAPPSSILATRVVNGNDSADFNQASFNQLLEESLGTDENGEPNLGSDTSINHKLICIIVKAGVDAFIEDAQDNPFQSSRSTSKDHAQFSSCLDVICIAIVKAPEVIFVKSTPEHSPSGNVQTPLYVWLIPKLLPLLRPNTPHNSREGILKLISAILAADNDPLKGSQGNNVFDFILGCVTGTRPPSLLHLQLMDAK